MARYRNEQDELIPALRRQGLLYFFDIIDAGRRVDGSETFILRNLDPYQTADLILRVTPPTLAEIVALPEASVLIGLLRPYESRERLAALNARRITAFSLELLPRISRAQSMDALSSQASCAGYQCGLIAAARCTKFSSLL